MQRLIKRMALRKAHAFVTAGGETRAQSVQNGLAGLESAFQMDCGARWGSTLGDRAYYREYAQGRTAAWRRDCGLPQQRHSEAGLVATLLIHTTPPRDTVWLAQTPQIFRRDILLRAHAKSRDAAVTDDAQLVERLGLSVSLVESPMDNLKVTLPTDLDVARHLVKRR